jgi:hypothetical protein
MLYKVEIIFPRSLLRCQHNCFSPWLQKLYAGRLNLFAEASEIFTHAVFQLVVVRKTTSSECIFEDAKKRVLNGGCRVDEGEGGQGADF